MLYEARCECGKLLGKIKGHYEIKCPRCKLLQGGLLPKPQTDKKYDPIKGV
jgi:phage FluMu protein Com